MKQPSSFGNYPSSSSILHLALLFLRNHPTLILLSSVSITDARFHDVHQYFTQIHVHPSSSSPDIQQLCLQHVNHSYEW